MTSFIFDVLKDLQKTNANFSELTFILPSKRAGVFLKHQLASIIKQTIFAPKVISIEAFVEDLSQLKNSTNTHLIFEFYTIYCKLTKEKDRDSFESFTKWAQILIQDFNEIDRYLIPQKNIFEYLSAIQDLKHWSLENNKTQFVKNYLAFWKKLKTYYDNFTQHLLNENIGYQGLIYREAVDNLESYIQNNPKTQHIFLGFNALNTCEEVIIQELLQNDLASIYWDIDNVFINNKLHDAGLFTRQHKSKWPYFKKNTFNWITNNYAEEKNISVCGIPKNVGQAKYIGALLKELQQKDASLQNTAVVLGDENLLIPVLNSLPTTIKALNITMGFPLKSIPLASLFDALFNLHKIASNSFYYKDVISILSHQFIRPLFQLESIDYASKIIDVIDRNNIVYLDKNRIGSITGDKENNIVNILFSNWDTSAQIALKNCTKLILALKAHFNLNKNSNLLQLEYLFRFNELFNELSRLNDKYPYLKDVSTLYHVYKELLSAETLDFQGEPLEGLQIMGMLESRVLDFETIIISSVNEGILPSGKSNNSFIPFDVKLENNLPTYKEKDAVYTYHFYRLLQRAKHVFILYNTEADVLTGGEKSRFITQLDLEGIHNIDHKIIMPHVPKITQSRTIIKKTKALHDHILKIVKKGVSPSSLTNYIRNPIDFYYQKILNISEYNTVEETIAANTLGTVVHNTLEDLYKPLVGTILSASSIVNLKPNIEESVRHHFKNEFKEGDITKGKNLIIFEIAKRYVLNFINLEIKNLKEGHEIKIIAIEANSELVINIPEINTPVKLKGKVDRIDQFNGITRIIDYKTGKVQQNQVEVVDWGDITSDYKKYSKSFQILTYAYMLKKANTITLPIEAGIISFKNLNAGVLKFAKKESAFSRSKYTLITDDVLLDFENELTILIKEICNPNIDFIEKEI